MNENKPLISVVMPCYQNAGTVERTVRSVQAQTEERWELIAVDDGSGDDTLAVLNRLAESEPRMHVIHQENGGVSAARNAGVRQAKGKWLFFVDADDHLTADAFEKLLSAADEETDIICAAYQVHEAGCDVLGQKYTCPDGSLHQILESLIRGDSALNSPCARLYRREMIRQNGIAFPAGVKVGEDVLLNLDAFMAARAWRMMDDVIYIYEFGGDSAMARAKGDRYARTLPMIEGIGRFLDRRALNTELFRAHIDIYLRTLRVDRSRFGAACAMNRNMVAAMTRNVNFAALSAREKLYYLALKLLPISSFLLP